MAATWDDIRSLAADLQRVQLGSARQRLTERNCIEIVQRLSEMGLIKLIYTCDGKTFLTEAELAKEIYEELELNGFRVNVVALQEALNVDLSQVELQLREIMKADPQLHLVNGELMHETYFRQIATEVNEILYERGLVSIGDLTKSYNFSTQTMLGTVKQYLGSVIEAQMEGDTLYTSGHLRRYRALVRGYFSGVLKPVSVSAAASALKVPEAFVRSVLDELMADGWLKGVYQSGRSTYAPSCFLKAQEDWLKQFFEQNDYLELETVKRYGVATDAKSYLRKLLGDERLVFLKTCAVSRSLVASLESCLHGVRWLSLSNMLPSPLTDADIDALVSPLLAGRGDLSLVAGHFLVSKRWLGELRESFEPLLSEQAEALLKADPSLATSDAGGRSAAAKASEAAADAGGERETKAGGVGKIKSGGGAQGREIKVKATKNKYVRGAKASAKESATESRQEAAGLSASEVARHIRDFMEQQHDDADEASDELLESLRELLAPSLGASLQQKLASVLTADSANKRQAGAACQNKIATLVRQMRLFEKGALALADTELQTILFKHLLKSLGASVLGAFLEFVAIGSGQDEPCPASTIASLAPEQRQKLIAQLPQSEEKDWLTLLNIALNGDSLEKVHQHIERLADKLGFMFKQLDKKTEKSLCAETGAQLAESLDGDCDPELALLIATSLLVQATTGYPVHAPGRAVPLLIGHLSGKLKDPASYELLQAAQELVVRKAKKEPGVSAEIEATFPKVVQLGRSWKSAVASKK